MLTATRALSVHRAKEVEAHVSTRKSTRTHVYMCMQTGVHRTTHASETGIRTWAAGCLPQLVSFSPASPSGSVVPGPQPPPSRPPLRALWVHHSVGNQLGKFHFQTHFLEHHFADVSFTFHTSTRFQCPSVTCLCRGHSPGSEPPPAAGSWRPLSYPRSRPGPRSPAPASPETRPLWTVRSSGTVGKGSFLSGFFPHPNHGT